MWCSSPPPANFLCVHVYRCTCAAASKDKTYGPYISGPVHTCRAGSSATYVFLFHSSFFLSHSLLLRGVVQSFTLEKYLFLPFLAGFRDPSSEKLTGPVQFPVSSPLSRLNCCALVRKWVSLFEIYCPCSANTNTANAHHRNVTHTHTQIH